MKYKVGDTVRVRKWDDMAKEYGACSAFIANGFIAPMRKYCGKTATIMAIQGNYYFINDDDRNWRFTDEMFAQPQLIIEHHGRTTVAHIGKTYGVARCNPDDKYDAMTGDILAVQRLYAKKAPKKKIINTNSGMCYGIIGEPSPFKDINGKPLKVGDCVDDGTPHNSFIAHDGKFGFYVMGWGVDGEHLDKPLRKVDDYDHEFFPSFKVVSE